VTSKKGVQITAQSGYFHTIQKWVPDEPTIHVVSDSCIIKRKKQPFPAVLICLPISLYGIGLVVFRTKPIHYTIGFLLVDFTENPKVCPIPSAC
jgi:hypothetical protein